MNHQMLPFLSSTESGLDSMSTIEGSLLRDDDIGKLMSKRLRDNISSLSSDTHRMAEMVKVLNTGATDAAPNLIHLSIMRRLQSSNNKMLRDVLVYYEVFQVNRGHILNCTIFLFQESNSGQAE